MLSSLSVRIAESPRDKTRLAVPVATLLDLAADAGFDGISVRASAVSVRSHPRDVRALHNALETRGLATSMVTGDLPLAVNDEHATRALADIEPYLDLAGELDCSLVRVMLHAPEDIALARRAAERAAERGFTLVQQCHWGSMAETAEGAAALARRVDHRGFGLTLEPANLLACGSNFGTRAVEQLGPWLRNVYYQNLRCDETSSLTFDTRARGPVGVRFLPLFDPGGIDVTELADALHQIGYDSWFTIHQPLLPGQDLSAVVRDAARLASTVVARTRVVPGEPPAHSLE